MTDNSGDPEITINQQLADYVGIMILSETLHKLLRHGHALIAKNIVEAEYYYTGYEFLWTHYSLIRRAYIAEYKQKET